MAETCGGCGREMHRAFTSLVDGEDGKPVTRAQETWVGADDPYRAAVKVIGIIVAPTEAP